MQKVLRNNWIRVLSLALVMAICSVVIAEIVYRDDGSGEIDIEKTFDSALYEYYIDNGLFTDAELLADFNYAQTQWMPLVLPCMKAFTQNVGITYFETEGFLDEFLEGLLPVEIEGGAVVYPVIVREDPETRERIFSNIDGKEIGVADPPKDYDWRWYLLEQYPDLYTASYSKEEIARLEELCDPSKLALRYDLMLKDDLVKYVMYLSLQPPGGGGEKLGWEGGSVTNIQFVDIDRTNGEIAVLVAYPNNFTNVLSLVACTNMLTEDWSLLMSTNPSATTNTFAYVDHDSTNHTLRFYACFNADYDGDGDGVSDGQEQFLDGTDPEDPNDPPNVKGTVTYDTYSGGQTGLIWVVAVTASNSWSTNFNDQLTVTGAYHVIDIPVSNYWLKAWRDTDGNEAPNGNEATGVYSAVSIAVTGQVTNVNITLVDVDSDSDGMGDWWEYAYFVTLDRTASDDDDIDKLINLYEYYAGTDPTAGFVDDDDDGIANDWEVYFGFDKNDPGDANEDPDGDGFSNFEEFDNNGSPTTSTDPNDATDHPAGAVYVSTTGSDATGDGSYTNAYASISNGIAQASSGQRVVIMPGDYDGPTNRGLDFAGKSILVTGLKGYRNDTEIDCDDLNRGFTFHSGETTNAILRYLTIRDGEAYRGGGVYCTNASPTLLKCTIRENNSTDDGGGVYAALGAQPVIDDCEIRDNASGDKGGGVYLRNGGWLIDSKINDNTSLDDGGGIYLYSGGTVTNCKVNGNTAEGRGDNDTGGDGGGGVYLRTGGSVMNCTISGNWAYYGGGIYCRTNNPTVANCMITDNDGDNRAGGIYIEASGTVNGCTVVANRAHEYGGGVYCYGNGVFNNTIIYHNTAAVRPNWYNTTVGTQTYRNCCTIPSVGTSAVTNAPLLAGRENPHLVADSPCRDAGTNTYASGADIDGEVRIYNTTVDIGCDEYVATNIVDALDVDIDILGDTTNVLLNVPVVFQADIDGQAFRFEWRIETESGPIILTNVVEITRQWSTTGVYEVTLWATNAGGEVAETNVLNVAGGFTNYVSPGGGQAWPFTSWADAATNIEDAADAAYAGGMVLVTNGIYNEDNIVITKPLTVQSVNGAAVTTVQGNGNDRMFRLDGADIVLDGFTITGGGGSRRAGGVYVRHGGTVRDCIITDNEALNDGGGVFIYDGGTVTNCTIANNSSGSDAGGVRIDYGGLLVNSLITNNVTFNRGGGVHLHRHGTVSTCDIKWNSQTNSGDEAGGGIAFRNGWSNAIVEYCTIEYNDAWRGGGAHVESEGTSDDGIPHGRAVLRHCEISGNTAGDDGGGVNADGNADVKNCLVLNNSAGDDAGGARVDDGSHLINSTVSANAAVTGDGDGVRCQQDSAVYNCIIYGNTGGDDTAVKDNGFFVYSCASDLVGGTGNITSNPLFVNAGAGNYRLQSGSPCTNTGSNAYVDWSLDLDGSNRIVNVTVDMGAYEVQ